MTGRGHNVEVKGANVDQALTMALIESDRRVLVDPKVLAAAFGFDAFHTDGGTQVCLGANEVFDDVARAPLKELNVFVLREVKNAGCLALAVGDFKNCLHDGLVALHRLCKQTCANHQHDQPQMRQQRQQR